MNRRIIIPMVVVWWLISMTAIASAQSLSQRIEHLKQQRQQQAAASEQRIQRPTISIRQRLIQTINIVNFQQKPLRDAYLWWSRVTGIPLQMDWNELTLEGINPDQRIDLHLQQITAAQVLAILMQRTGNTANVRMMFEATPWYMKILTKTQADRRPVLRIYEVSDLLHETPHFTNAPEFDLSSVLESSSGGGSGGSGSSSSLFNDTDNENEKAPSKTERGEALAQLIRDTIEPNIWQANGGVYSSIRYLNGKLIVRAPLYVQRQIGLPANTPYISRTQTPSYPSPMTSRVIPRPVVAQRTDQRTANAVRQRLENQTIKTGN